MKSKEDFYESVLQQLQFMEALDKQNESRASDYGQDWFRKRFMKLISKLSPEQITDILGKKLGAKEMLEEMDRAVRENRLQDKLR